MRNEVGLGAVPVPQKPTSKLCPGAVGEFQLMPVTATVVADSFLNWPFQVPFNCPLGISKRSVHAPLAVLPGLRMVAREQKPPDQTSCAIVRLSAAWAGAIAPQASAMRLRRWTSRRGMACMTVPE